MKFLKVQRRPNLGAQIRRGLHPSCTKEMLYLYGFFIADSPNNSNTDVIDLGEIRLIHTDVLQNLDNTLPHTDTTVLWRNETRPDGILRMESSRFPPFLKTLFITRPPLEPNGWLHDLNTLCMGLIKLTT